MTLEEQLCALMDQHSLTHIAVAVYTLQDGTRYFGGAAHGGKLVGFGDATGTSSGAAAKALNGAITALEAKRLKLEPVADMMPMGEAA